MKISTGTIVRTIVLFLAFLNQILTILGRNPLPIADEDVSGIVTMAVALWAWWKNNSFTAEAMEGDKRMNMLRNGR